MQPTLVEGLFAAGASAETAVFHHLQDSCRFPGTDASGENAALPVTPYRPLQLREQPVSAQEEGILLLLGHLVEQGPQGELPRRPELAETSCRAEFTGQTAARQSGQWERSVAAKSL